MSQRALLLEAHHTTHIEGTHLTLEQSERLLAGEDVSGADPDDVRELLNYRDAFAFVSAYLNDGGPITEGFIREIHKHLVSGLATQMQETADRGRRVIKTDLLAQEHRLNDRQLVALRHLLDHGSLAIRQLEELCPEVSRRTLQRDLSGLEKLGLVVQAGETNQLNYLLGKEL